MQVAMDNAARVRGDDKSDAIVDGAVAKISLPVELLWMLLVKLLLLLLLLALSPPPPLTCTRSPSSSSTS